MYEVANLESKGFPTLYHIAIMKRSWRLPEKILSGEKTIETRWYKNKVAPWDRISVGDQIYFKDSGEQVTVKAVVSAVEQYSDLTSKSARQIFAKYALEDLGNYDLYEEILGHISDKRYAIVIHLRNPQRVEPFDIDKAGFGAMSAWLCVKDISQVAIHFPRKS